MSKYPIGSYVEIQRGATWKAAEVADDDDEDEILVKILETGHEEWICYKSVGIRKIDKPPDVVKPKPKETPIAPVEQDITIPVVEEVEVVVEEPPKESLVTETIAFLSKYKVGDSVLAAWSKSKNYQARVEAVLPNKEYRVQFEDGLKKIVSEDQMTKEADIIPDPSYPKYTTRHKSIDFNSLQNVSEETTHKKKKKKREKLKIKFSFPQKSKTGGSTGEVRCEIVTEAEVHHAPKENIDADIDKTHIADHAPVFDMTQPFLIHRKDGSSQYSIPMSDYNLPPGWYKHKAYFNGKWQAILINSENRKFFGKKSLVKYIAQNNLDYSIDMFDFSYMENPKLRRSSNVNVEKKIKTLPPSVPTTPVTPSPPIFSDFNLSISGNYVCPNSDCKKEFRKENLLMMHLKHYHPEFKNMLPPALNVADLAYARTNSMDDKEETTKPVKKNSGNFDVLQNVTTTPKFSPPRTPQVSPITKTQPEQLHTCTPKPEIVAHQYPTTLPSEIKRKELDRVDVSDDSMEVDFESQIAHFEITKKSDELKSKTSGGSSTSKKEPSTPEKKENEVKSFTSPPSMKYEKMKKEEVVNCVCGVLEEDGLMIQCDICLCWQHSQCANIETESEVPEKYVCKICKNPPLLRKSQMYAYDHDWLHKGTLPTLDPSNKQYDEEFLRTQNILCETHSITGNLCKLSDSMHNTNVKMQIVQEPNHPKMYLWSKCVTEEQKDSQEVDQGPKIPEPEAPIDSQDCRLNLLAQIENDYELMEQRLNELEEQICNVEADSSSLMGDPANDKPTLQMLLRDLETLRTLAIVN